MPDRSPTWRRVSPVYWLRPAEVVTVLFTAYLLVRSIGHPLDAPNVPRVDMFSALMLAVLGGQILRYRRLPWPEDTDFSVKHWILFPVTLIPLAADVAFVLLKTDWEFNAREGGYLAEVVFGTFWVVRRFAFIGLPLVLFWLALGIHIKTTHAIHPKVFLGEVGRGLGNAIRDWAPPVVLTFLYGSLGSVLQNTGIPDQDAHLAAIDRFLFFGHNPVAELQHVISRPLSEWVTFCYAFYAPLFPLAFGFLFAQRDRRGFHELATAISLSLAIGYVGYTLVPAVGPAFAEKFDVSLDDYYFRFVKEELMDRYRVQRDCFPSLHTCVSLVFLWGSWRHLRPLGRFLVPIVATIPFACVYLRYHYVVDVLAGLTLFAAVTRVTPGLLDRRERAWTAASPPAPSPS